MPLRSHDVTFHASHPVLADFAVDLARTLTHPVGREIAVQVGAHRRDPALPAGAVRLGIQTEQMRDEAGTPLWKAFSEARIAEFVERFDTVLDLSPANAPAYAFLPPDRLARVRFGPHVYPETAPPHRPGGDGLLFVGALNERRKAGLSHLAHCMPVSQVPEGTFGPALDALIGTSAGLLNLHFHSGTYTEHPRLLKALLNGKILVSEPLAAPLITGAHYAGIDDWPLRPQGMARIHDGAAALLATRFAFRPFLLSCVIACSPRQEGSTQ